MTEAEIILDSINVVTGDRITTLRVVMPRIILAEVSTHRVVFLDDMLGAYDADIPSPLTKNSASSRAVPTRKMIDRVVNQPFIPKFRYASKGMASGEPVDTETQFFAQKIVQNALAQMAWATEMLHQYGIEKGQANRYLEPFSYIEVLLTATEWNNFLMLRDHPAAQVEIQEVARAIRAAMDNSTPQPLCPGDWHLPYITPDENYDLSIMEWTQQKVSAARCARISYKSFDTGKPSTIEEDLTLFEKLAGSNPRHLAPLEPPAQAQDNRDRYGNFIGFKPLRKIMFAGEESGGDLK